MTKLLVIETALRGAALAFVEWEENSPLYIRAEAYFTEAHAATAALHHLWTKIQNETRWSIEDLDAVVVDRGPGSFTGVKVGIAFAQALHFGTGDKLPCMGVSGLSARAHGEQERLFVLPANRSQGFFALRQQGKESSFLGLMQLDQEIEFFTIERQPLERSQITPKSIALLQNWPEFEKMGGAFGLNASIDDSETILRHAIRHLAEESRRQIKSGGDIKNHPIEPLYISYSAPEEKLLAQKAKETQWPKK